jgi:hypothetical protein
MNTVSPAPGKSDNFSWAFSRPSHICFPDTDLHPGTATMVAFILFNGPKFSGKTTAMSLVMSKLDPMAAESGKILRSVAVSDELKRRTHELYGMRDLAPSHFGASKDLSLAEFGGRTPRDAYIDMFDTVINPKLGPSGLGTLLTDRLIESSTDVALIDAGLQSEAEAIVERLGAADAMIVRIHREGAAFGGTDYRGYIDIPGVRSLDIRNPSPVRASPFSPVSGERGLARFAEQLEQSVVPHAARALTPPHWLEMAVDAETPNLAARSAASALRVAGVRLHGKGQVTELPHGYAVRFSGTVGDGVALRIAKMFGPMVQYSETGSETPSFPAFGPEMFGVEPAPESVNRPGI